MEYRYVKFETSYIISFSKKIISFKIKCDYIISINRFKIRHENDWEGYDSFYDAWLYKNKMRTPVTYGLSPKPIFLKALHGTNFSSKFFFQLKGDIFLILEIAVPN